MKLAKSEEIPSRDVVLKAPVGMLRMVLPEGWEPEVRDGYDDEWVADAPDGAATIYIKLDPTDGVRRSCGFAGDNHGLMLELARRVVSIANDAQCRDVKVQQRDLGQAVHVETSYLAPDGQAESIFFAWGRFLDMADAGVRSLRITLAADPDLATLPALCDLFAGQADRLAGQINGEGWHRREDVASQMVELDCLAGSCNFLLPFDWSPRRGDNGIWMCTSPDGNQLVEVDCTYVSGIGEHDSGKGLKGIALVQAMAGQAAGFLRGLDLDGDVALTDSGDRMVVHGAFRTDSERPEYVRRWYAFCAVDDQCVLFRVTYGCPLSLGHAAQAMALDDYFGAQVDALDINGLKAGDRRSATPKSPADPPPLDPGWTRLATEAAAYTFPIAMPLAWTWQRHNENSWSAEAPDGLGEIRVTVELVDEVDDVAASVRRLTNGMIERMKQDYGRVALKTWRGPAQALIGASFEGDDGGGAMQCFAWMMLRGIADRREVLMRHEFLVIPLDYASTADGRALLSAFKRQRTGFLPDLPDDF